MVTPATTHISVSTQRGQRQSFWRAGMQFSRQPRVVALADISTPQLKQIKADPRLLVENLIISCRPDDQATAITQIIDAINTLPSNNADNPDGNWTGKGLPQIAALQQALGWPITAAERDTAWAQLNGNGSSQ